MSGYITEEDVKKAFRILPNQGTGVYRFDNCSHGELITLKASDPYDHVTICPNCLALTLNEDKEEVRQQ